MEGKKERMKESRKRKKNIYIYTERLCFEVGKTIPKPGRFGPVQGKKKKRRKKKRENKEKNGKENPEK
ncbi:hypothetical protein Sjap_004656 [Stephania japonica]|uniref:Uncharacterized protein n=1 Tax=Stephania japonica TaxID=461633 RepID=A0AAP0K451_9MAGN